jgi:hypothetical protein
MLNALHLEDSIMKRKLQNNLNYITCTNFFADRIINTLLDIASQRKISEGNVVPSQIDTAAATV